MTRVYSDPLSLPQLVEICVEIEPAISVVVKVGQWWCGDGHCIAGFQMNWLDL